LQIVGGAKKSKNRRKSKNLKNENLPNVPQARLIENLSGQLCQQVYEGGWEAKSETQLIRRIKAKIKRIIGTSKLF
jgi:hypothetical protein